MLANKGIPYALIIICLLSHVLCDDWFTSKFVNSFESLSALAKTFLHGVKKIGKSIKYVEDFVDSTIEEDCQFSCKRNEYSVPDTKSALKPNGCGSFGFILVKEELPIPEMEGCCDEHDMCYSTCGSEKDTCDLFLKKCLYGQCELKKKEANVLSLKSCKAGAKVLYTTTVAFGCAAFKEAQQSSCKCLSIGKTEL